MSAYLCCAAAPAPVGQVQVARLLSKTPTAPHRSLGSAVLLEDPPVTHLPLVASWIPGTPPLYMSAPWGPREMPTCLLCLQHSLACVPVRLHRRPAGSPPDLCLLGPGAALRPAGACRGEVLTSCCGGGNRRMRCSSSGRSGCSAGTGRRAQRGRSDTPATPAGRSSSPSPPHPPQVHRSDSA